MAGSKGGVWAAWVVAAGILGSGCGASEDMGLSSVSAAETGDWGRFCGGVGNIPCPTGSVCQENKTGHCDSERGGADCGGICVPAEVEAELTSCGGEPGYHYVLTDPIACQGVRFKCAAGFTAFFNACGCGCKPAP